MLTRPDFMYKQIIFIFTHQGEKLSFKNDNLIVQGSDKKIKHQSTCYRLFSLFIVGHISLTSGLIQRAKKFKFNIVLLTHNLSPYACINAQTEGNVLLRSKQYQYNDTEIAKHLVKNKLQMQLSMMKRIRPKANKQKKAIDTLKHLLSVIKVDNLGFEQLLSIEGQAAKIYFKAMFDVDQWEGRKPRTKINPTNTLLDIGYTLLFNLMEALLGLYGFDLYKGVYHRAFYQRKSLVCDLMEPARPMIDYRIRKAIQLNQVHKKDFHYHQGQYFLLGKTAVPYSTFLLETILEHKEALFLYVQRYYRCFMQDQAIEYYPLFNLEKKKAS